jgi:hypothetical protein
MEGYNADDCRSTAALRDWLESERAKKALEGSGIPRFAPKDSEPKEDLKEWQARVAAIVKELTKDVPTDANRRLPDQRAQWLIAQLIDWHWREGKPAAWEFYSLADKNGEQLLHEKKSCIRARLRRSSRESEGEGYPSIQLPEARDGCSRRQGDVAPPTADWQFDCDRLAESNQCFDGGPDDWIRERIGLHWSYSFQHLARTRPPEM